MPSTCRGEPSRRHAFETDGERIGIDGPQGIQATFDWQASQPVAQAIDRSGGAIEGEEGPEGSDPGTGRMATATLINDVDQY